MGMTRKLADRIESGLRRFRPVLAAQRDRDVSEADTVTLVKDILSEVFGYDKYAELTSEHAIRGTYCDLAIQFDGKVQLLIEVKAVGTALQERHVRQAIDYAANEGVEWVILTNAVEWVLYHVLFRQPIDREEIIRLNLLDVDASEEQTQGKLYLLTRAGLTKDALTDYRDRQDATNRFMLAAILVHSDAVLRTIRREVRRVSDILIETEEIACALRDQVIKRDTLEGEQAAAAAKRLNRRAERAIPKARIEIQSAESLRTEKPAQGAAPGA